MLRITTLLILAAGLAACGTDVYVQDGRGAGNTFHVPPAALANSSPQVQSWIAYSLARGTCQVAFGGASPSGHRSYDCEFRARRILAERWIELAAYTAHRDDYLDTLANVREADLLDEYVWVYHRERGWPMPTHLELERFDTWRRNALDGHSPKTRMIGYWAGLAR